MIFIILMLIAMAITALYAMWLAMAVWMEIVKERHDESGCDPRAEDALQQVPEQGLVREDKGSTDDSDQCDLRQGGR